MLGEFVECCKKHFAKEAILDCNSFHSFIVRFEVSFGVFLSFQFWDIPHLMVPPKMKTPLLGNVDLWMRLQALCSQATLLGRPVCFLQPWSTNLCVQGFVSGSLGCNSVHVHTIFDKRMKVILLKIARGKNG